MRTHDIVRSRCAIIVLLVVNVVMSDTPTSAAPAPTTRDVSPEIARIIEKSNVPGMVVAVVEGDRIVMSGAAGARKRGSDAKVTLDDQFHIGSDTKAITATLCAMLVEDGKLSWSTTIGDAFPKLRDRMNVDYRNVTLEQLLTHHGGAPPNLDFNGLWSRLWSHHDPVESRQALLEGVVIGQAPVAPPGTKYVYSNSGFAIAGHMAETVMKTPWEQLVRKRIFAPLKMTSAGFGAPGTAAKLDQPRGHKPDGTPVEPGPAADNPPAIGPAGTIHCTIGDWAKFISLHLRGEQAGSAPLLKPESFKKLHAPVTGKDAAEPDYAMGWLVTSRPWAGGECLTHAGSNTMWYAVAWVAPRKNFAVLVMCNQGGDGAAKACDDAASALIVEYLKNAPTTERAQDR
jgi:CubicO group peptidase (beta-lactamase class C family)